VKIDVAEVNDTKIELHICNLAFNFIESDLKAKCGERAGAVQTWFNSREYTKLLNTFGTTGGKLSLTLDETTLEFQLGKDVFKSVADRKAYQKK